MVHRGVALSVCRQSGEMIWITILIGQYINNEAHQILRTKAIFGMGCFSFECPLHLFEWNWFWHVRYWLLHGGSVSESVDNSVCIWSTQAIVDCVAVKMNVYCLRACVCIFADVSKKSNHTDQSTNKSDFDCNLLCLFPPIGFVRIEYICLIACIFMVILDWSMSSQTQKQCNNKKAHERT